MAGFDDCPPGDGNTQAQSPLQDQPGRFWLSLLDEQLGKWKQREIRAEAHPLCRPLETLQISHFFVEFARRNVSQLKGECDSLPSFVF